MAVPWRALTVLTPRGCPRSRGGSSGRGYPYGQSHQVGGPARQGIRTCPHLYRAPWCKSEPNPKAKMSGPGQRPLSLTPQGCPRSRGGTSMRGRCFPGRHVRDPPKVTPSVPVLHRAGTVQPGRNTCSAGTMSPTRGYVSLIPVVSTISTHRNGVAGSQERECVAPGWANVGGSTPIELMPDS